MSNLQQYKIKPEQFLTIVTNILYKTMLEAPRTDAKKIFKAIEDGKRVSLIDVRMENDADVRFDLSLDKSEYRGERLNFGAFRNSLTGLVGTLSENLRTEKKMSVFTEKVDGSMLFGVPGVTTEDGNVNVLMLAANLSGPGSVLLKLQYMDPDQFRVDEQQAG